MSAFPEHTPEGLDITFSATCAELFLSPKYRAALNGAFDANPEGYEEQRENALDFLVGKIAVETFAVEPNNYNALLWEARRIRVLESLSIAPEKGVFGMFGTLIPNEGGHEKTTDKTIEDLPPGATEIVSTNTRVVSLSKLPGDPIDFIESALDEIKNARPSAIGPENYATALKLFSDKYLAMETTHLDQEIVRITVNDALAGFSEVTQEDKPNFVEMTNTYVAILRLPQGTVEQRHTQMLLFHSLEQLPSFNADTIRLMIATLCKLDLSKHGEAAATLIDLGLRKNKPLETTRDYRNTLRAIANLPKGTVGVDGAFKTFLEMGCNLETPLDIEGLEEVNYRLFTIARDNLHDENMRQCAKKLAFDNAVAAKAIIDRHKNRGDVTEDQLQDLETKFTRIKQLYARVYELTAISEV